MANPIAKLELLSNHLLLELWLNVYYYHVLFPWKRNIPSLEILHLLHPRLICVKLVDIGPVALIKVFKVFNVFLLVLPLSLLWECHGPIFTLTWVPLPKHDLLVILRVVNTCCTHFLLSPLEKNLALYLIWISLNKGNIVDKSFDNDPKFATTMTITAFGSGELKVLKSQQKVVRVYPLTVI